MAEPLMTVQQFASSVKSKYPQYADMPDDELARSMIAKYPVYAEQVDYRTFKPARELAPSKPAAAAPAESAESWDGGSHVMAPTPEPPRTVGGFLGNIPESAGRMVSDIKTAVTHPVETAKALGNVAVGGLQKGAVAFGAAPPAERGLEDKRESFDALSDGLKARYGNVEAAKKTAYDDPVGFLVDVSALFSGGGSAAGRAGLSRTARVLGATAEAIDPVRQTARAAGAVAKGATATGAAILGKATGVGGEVVRTAASAPKGFKEGMRGLVSDEDVLASVKDATQQLADRRQDAYTKQLAQLPSNVVLDTAAANGEMSRQLARFGVKLKLKAGQYVADFANSKITDATEQATIQSVIDDLSSRAGKQLSPADMDTLKQRISNRVGSGSRADAVVNAAKDAVRQTLNKNVPGYEEMTRGYHEATQLLEKLKAELGATADAKKTGTAIRKIRTALNQRNELRSALIDVLDAETGSNIKGALAGLEMSKIAPRGIAGPLVGVSAVTSAVTNPLALIGLAMTSPRLVGEAMMAIAAVRKAGSKLPKPPAAAVSPRVLAPVRGVGATTKEEQKRLQR